MSGTKRKKIIERIQLLFNRAATKVENSSNPDEVDHEAQSALEMARRLMLQYNLEMIDIETLGAVQGAKTGPDNGESTVEFKTKQTAKWTLSLAVVISDYFECKVMYMNPTTWSGGKLVYYGVKLNANLAAYAFQSVFNQIRTLSKKYKVKRETWECSPLGQYYYNTFESYRNAAKREYQEGLIWGFAKRLKELKEEEKISENGEKIVALALRYDEIAKDYLAKQDYHTKERQCRKHRKHTGGKYYADGETDSNQVQLRQGLGK